MIKKNSSRILLVLTITTNIIYIIWRIFYTIPDLINIPTIFFSISLIIVEVVGMFEFFTSFYGMVKSYDPPKPEIDYDLYPDVDIYIATYNEPVDLVQKTVNGCLHIQYPDKSKVRIFICDDGRRPAMQAMAKKHGVGYIIRATNEHAKAGNLNNAMKYTTAPLILTMDADMIPMHHILMETVPYFLENEQARKYGQKEEFPKIGFIQTPQSFYNTDLFQFNLHSENRIPNEQDYFYRNIQCSRNANNTVIYGGSNTLISRQALNDVGGFFTNSITEDFATGMKIQAKGYVCYAISKVCASGLSPESLKTLVKQRERWGRGCIQTARRVNLLFMKGLTIGQKISYFSSISYWYASIKRFFYIMSPIVFAVFNIQVVDCTILEVLIFWLPSYVTTNLTLKKLSSNIRNRRWTNIYETVMFQAMMIPVILETFCISQNKFSVTIKEKNGDTESTYRTLLALPYFIYVILSFIGIFRMVYYTVLHEQGSFVVVIFWLISNLFNIIMSIFFLLGRKQFRNTERFDATVEGCMRQGTSEVYTNTSDISEKGFSFKYDKPIYIDPNTDFLAYFKMDGPHETYYSCLRSKVVQVIDIGNNWKYACKFDVECVMRQGESEYRFYTSDLTQEGFSFVYDKPIPMSQNTIFDAYFRTTDPNQAYSTCFKLKIVKVEELEEQDRKKWRYNCEFGVESVIRLGAFEYNIFASSITSDGFSFVYNDQVCQKPDNTLFDAYFKTIDPNQPYSNCLKFKIVKKDDKDITKCRYCCNFGEIYNGYSGVDKSYIETYQHNINQWNLIVHDRVPSLPQTIEGSLGFYQDLEVNINKRLKKIPFYSRKTARINTLLQHTTRCGLNVIIRNFNYEYIGIQKGSTPTFPKDIEIVIANEFVIKATREDGVQPPEIVLYRISNIKEIVENSRHRGILLDWVIYGNTQLKMRLEQNSMRVSAQKKASGDLTDFV